MHIENIKLLFIFSVLSAASFAAEDSKLNLEDIELTQKYQILGPQVNWMGGNHLLIEASEDPIGNRVDVLDPHTLKAELLFYRKDLILPGHSKPIEFSNTQLSPSGEYLLLTGQLPSRGLKNGGSIYLYHLRTKTLEKVAGEEDGWSLLEFSPTGQEIAYVKNHNIHVYSVAGKKSRQLTFDGSETVLNGEFDWVYEEEFGIIQGWRWSPSGKYIAFWQSDQSDVPLFPLMNFATPHPQIHWMHYPKAGDPNSKVRVGILEVASGGQRWVDTGFRGEHYIPRINWGKNDGALFVQILNRVQNNLDLMKVDLSSGGSQYILQESQPNWVEVHDNFIPLEENIFLWTSERDGFNHAYLVQDGEMKQLTSGAWEVQSIFGSQGDWVYFQGNRDSIFESHAYRISKVTGRLDRLTESDLSHSVSFSSDFQFFLDTASSVSTPPRKQLVKTWTQDVISTFTRVPKSLEALKLGRTELFTFVTDDGVSLNGRITVPDKYSANKRFPVLLDVYGGPGSQKALNQWMGLWNHYLAQQGVVVVSVDNRGTGGRGKRFKDLIYGKAGILESDDQMATARHLQKQPQVDPERIGIWGWSYGGYLSAMTLARGGNLFRTGVAVAPVSHWKYYDSIYTERFMGNPHQNIQGYEISSPMNHLDTMTASILVVHGTGDDNVHYQNSLELTNALLEKNKDFETLVYPYRAHSIRKGRYARYHLFSKLYEYLDRTLIQ